MQASRSAKWRRGTAAYDDIFFLFSTSVFQKQ
jgi:hypothetical protein